MKMTGEIQGKTLHEILGNKTKVLGTSEPLEYATLIAKMDTDKLFRHGMEEYGIKPSVSNSKNRKIFEKRCIESFRKTTKILRHSPPEQTKLPRSKKKQDALTKALQKGL